MIVLGKLKSGWTPEITPVGRPLNVNKNTMHNYTEMGHKGPVEFKELGYKLQSPFKKCSIVKYK